MFRRTLPRVVGFTALTLMIAFSVRFSAVLRSLAQLRLEEPCAEPDAQSGQEIVKMIHGFRQQNGLWPCTLDELKCDFGHAQKLEDWEYSWHPENWWVLTSISGRFNGQAIRYEYRPDFKGWSLTDGVSRHILGTAQPMPEPSQLSKDQLDQKKVQLIKRRISESPRIIVHHKGLIGWHLAQNRSIDARAACADCLQCLPDHWWPHTLLAVLEAREGKSDHAEKQLVQWVQKDPQFNRYFLLSQYYLLTGNRQRAFSAVAEGASHPLSTLRGTDDDGEKLRDGPLALPWIAANFALHQRQYDVAIAICDRWEQHNKQVDVSADRSYLLIRAACLLAKRRFDRAQEDMNTAHDLLDRMWAQNGRELGDAIAARDVSYVYKPFRSSLPSFELIIEYE